jgi:hypothetical protein
MKNIWNWIKKHPGWTIFIFWWLVALVIIFITISDNKGLYDYDWGWITGFLIAFLCATVAPALTYLLFRILAPNRSRVIGTLIIISGIIYMIGTVVYPILSSMYSTPWKPPADFIYGGIFFFIFGVFVVITGVLANKRKAWILVFIGSVCAIPAILGIPALILTLKSKNEFTSKGG